MRRALLTLVVVALSFGSGVSFERYRADERSSDELEALHWRVRVLELKVELLDERLKAAVKEFAELRVRTKALVPNVDEL